MPSVRAAPTRALACPKCGAALEAVRYASLEIDRCTGCHGMWFDACELDRALATPGAEDLDDGDASVGRRHDGQQRVKCPLCAVPMIRMAHMQQHHVWFETCGTCGGAWLDAGELRDLAVYDLFDRIRDLFTRTRR